MTGWIVVAAADHVARGLAGGFVQACHGKDAPLRRLRPGDVVIAYSPVRIFGETEPCRAFTAFGRIADGEPTRADMGGGFLPWRRSVAWAHAREAPIAPLLDRLGLTRGRRNWGAAFRFGLIRIDDADAAAIAAAMGVPSGSPVTPIRAAASWPRADSRRDDVPTPPMPAAGQQALPLPGPGARSASSGG